MEGGRRQMLGYALWRVKTDRARRLVGELLEDPTVARHAQNSARRIDRARR